MVKRTLPGLGLTGFWPLGDDTWKDENDVNLRNLSALAGGLVKSRSVALPGSPTLGDIYIVKSDDPTNPNKVAIWDGVAAAEAWVYLAPGKGWSFYVEDESKNYQFNGTAWLEFAGAAGGGGGGITVDPTAVFRARLSADVVGVTGNATVYTVQYNTIDAPQSFISHNTATGVATVLQDGVYFIEGCCKCEDVGGVGTQGEGGIYINGVLARIGSVEVTTEAVFPLQKSGFFNLSAGDTVAFGAQVAGAAGLDYDAKANTWQTYLEITRISPTVYEPTGAVDHARIGLNTVTAHPGGYVFTNPNYDTVYSDPAGMYDMANKRFQPTKAGMYLVSARVRFGGPVAASQVIYKNGVSVGTIGSSELTLRGPAGDGMVYCNGTTDYFEVRFQSSVATNYAADVNNCRIEVVGPLVSPSVERTYRDTLSLSGEASKDWAIPANCIRMKAMGRLVQGASASAVLSVALKRAADGIADSFDYSVFTESSGAVDLSVGPLILNLWNGGASIPTYVVHLDIVGPRSASEKIMSTGHILCANGGASTQQKRSADAVQSVAGDCDALSVTIDGGQTMTGTIEIEYTVLQ